MIYLLIILILIIISALIYWKYFFTYSKGNRTGILQNFSYRGNIIKTYEGELLLNNMYVNSNNIMAAEKFYFSVSDKDLAHELDHMQGKLLMVHYRQKNGCLFWQGESEYSVDSVMGM